MAGLVTDEESAPQRGGAERAGCGALEKVASCRARTTPVGRHAVVADEERGFGRYVDLRSRWDGLVHALAPGLAFSMEEVDLPATLAQKGP